MSSHSFFATLTLILLATGLWGQNRSFGTLPLVARPGASFLEDVPSSNDTAAYRLAVAVYDRLVQARGDFRYTVPKFSLSANRDRGAFIQYKKVEIFLEQDAYKVCASFGPENTEAAIAFLLAHELTHYYEKHAWRNGFVEQHADLAIGKQLDTLMDAVAKETEADYLGGFLMYSAGFGTFDKVEELIDRLYADYRLDEHMPGYPSLSDRKALAVRSSEQLKRLIEVFDMANMLTAVGRYSQAYEYYRYVLIQYQSREIYNNVGVVAVLDALQYFSDNEMKFRLPLQLDLESLGSKGDGWGDNREKRDTLLRQAILHFDAAISLDPDYAPAYLNKACAYLLMGDYTRARFYADTETKAAAQRGGLTKPITDADILLAIVDAMQGNQAAARATLERLKAADSPLAGFNLARLNGDPIIEETPPPPGLRQERIDNKSINLFAADPQVNPKAIMKIGPHVTFYQSVAKDFLFSQNAVTGDLIFFQPTPTGYDGKTARGITLGSDRAAIVAKYGEPGHTMETPQGQIMVYKAILFILDKNGKAMRWVNYLS